MNSTYKYYSTAFAIFEFHSFDQQTSVADDLQVMHSVSEDWVSLNWSFTIKWSGWRDLNARLLRPERSALPSWATSRHGPSITNLEWIVHPFFRLMGKSAKSWSPCSGCIPKKFPWRAFLQEDPICVFGIDMVGANREQFPGEKL